MKHDDLHHAYNRPRRRESSLGQRVTQAQNAALGRYKRKITLPVPDFLKQERPEKQDK